MDLDQHRAQKIDADGLFRDPEDIACLACARHEDIVGHQPRQRPQPMGIRQAAFRERRLLTDPQHR